MRKNSVYWDLGISNLLPQWKMIFTKQHLREDVIAGLTVACVAIPLSLAIALASGVTPAIGLVTAIIGGIVCAFFGGTPLAVTGPAAAMAVLIASIVQTHGLGGLLLIGIGCGILQVISGIFGWGRFARFVPMPVIAGFTAGIGAVIFIGQLPRALGLPAPKESETLNVITHLADYLHATNYTSLMLTGITMAVIFGLPRIAPKIPAIIIGVIASTLVTVGFGLETAIIGEIPNSLPFPKLPEFPSEGLGSIALATLTVFGLASLETLLSSTAVDKLARTTRHDPNQELIGQGLGNVMSSLFGGIPVTGVIARSALNVQSGARSRRSSLIHAIALLFTVYVASTLIAQIPIAALAGVLLAVSIRMMNPREFREILKVSRSEAFVYMFTFVTIVAVDLLVGIQVGVVTAIVIAAIRVGQTHVDVHDVQGGETARIHVGGPLSFLASNSLESIRSGIDSAKQTGVRKFVLDVSDVSRIDATGAEEMITIVRETIADGSRVVLQGLRPETRDTLLKADHENVLADRLAVTESDVQNALFGKQQRGIERLVYGITRFRKERESRYKELLEQLANGQSPHTLFLTCSDSRINPNLLTSTDLGELFVVRNVGNAFPPFRANGASSEASALEFSIKGLGIREIVICGHTGCGAMKAICGQADLTPMPGLKNYLHGESFTRLTEVKLNDPDTASRMNVMSQRANLMTYPFIRDLVNAGQLKIHLWIYDLKAADIDVWNDLTGRFETISYDHARVGKVPNNFVMPDFMPDASRPGAEAAP